MTRSLYWHNDHNFGDTLTPVIFGHFSPKPISRARREDSGKILGVGSVIWLARQNDTVIGTGTNRHHLIRSPGGVRYLMVRGPLTRALVTNATIPENYGDPALILPRIYHPKVETTYSIGFAPHYVDKHIVWNPALCLCRGSDIRCNYCLSQLGHSAKFIDIESGWKTVINDILSCRMIIASSLHAIVCAEAYGIPAIWKPYSRNVGGGDLKFQDYFLGTGRPRQQPGRLLPRIPNLPSIQERICSIIASEMRSGIE